MNGQPGASPGGRTEQAGTQTIGRSQKKSFSTVGTPNASNLVTGSEYDDEEWHES